MSWQPGSDEVRARWALDSTVTYLNHGSFGATPRSVLAEQTRLRAEMEAEPVEFLGRRLHERLGAVRERVASFLGADPCGLCFVSNATQGVASVLGSLDWREGDEIVIADHAYFAVKQAVRHLVDRCGVRFVPAVIPFPLDTPSQAADAFIAAITPRTRLVIADHVTSATALILPVEEIVVRAGSVPVLVDGAHAPGMLDLAIGRVGAAFYTGNLHKWLCAPKGCAILHVSPEWRERIHPTAISHAYGSGLLDEFDWTGTFDATAWLSIPAAIDHMEELGVDRVRAVNHDLVRTGRALIADALGTELPHPDLPALYGSMATIPFPASGNGFELTARLFAEHRIEVPFTNYDGRSWVRISGQAYNAPADYEKLAGVLRRWR